VIEFWGNVGTFAVAYDTDAQAYITAVETADGQALETGVRDAINAFVVGCKADGIWSAIKASCILAGARTLAGALVPLVGTAPTNFNFASGDYNRKTGLIGNGSTKYLNTSRAETSDPQNNMHWAVYTTSSPTNVASQFIFHGSDDTSSSGLYLSNGTTAALKSRNQTAADAITYAPGFFGASRSSSTSVAWRRLGTSGSASLASNTPSATAYNLFRSPSYSSQYYASVRVAFYSIGESLTLSLLDSRVSTLITAYAAAIP